jgi:phosphoserine phosphatase
MLPNSQSAWRPAVLFDFDSTLVSVEGLDELGRLKLDEGRARAIRAITDAAMSGQLPFEDALAQRLALLRPSVADLDTVADAYRHAFVPGAFDAIDRLQRADWHVAIVSGGLRAAIASSLKGSVDIPIHALEIDHDDAGNFVGVRTGTDGSCQPTATSDGKRRLVDLYRAAGHSPVVMVGDGATDQVAGAVADAFVCFTGVVLRETVASAADAIVSSMDEITPDRLLAVVRARRH